MSKGSGGTRSSSSKSPSSLALSAGASAATTSMKVLGSVSPELAKARSMLNSVIGFSDAPVRKIKFNEQTRTIEVDVYHVSEKTYVLGAKTKKPETIHNVYGEAGTTKVIDSKEVGMRNMTKHASISALDVASRVGDAFNDAGFRPERVIIRQKFVSPEKWDSVMKAYRKKRSKIK